MRADGFARILGFHIENCFLWLWSLLSRTLRVPEKRAREGVPWWESPGVGIMFQVEYRPGMDWDRNFNKFNRELMGPDGRLNFPGPFCRVDDWVALSKDVGADYHIFEAKWHDGICYFDTSLTNWKTPTDYAGAFAERSKAAGMPFLYYYSAVFDHNPMFDDIQPHKDRTASFLGNNRKYIDYALAQVSELVEKYDPDGMWIDWCWPDLLTHEITSLFRVRYPEKVFTFNASNYLPWSYKRFTYTSGEAHDLTGSFVRLVHMRGRTLVVFSSAWKWANLNRRLFDHPWELIGPAGKWWQNPETRKDEDELLRIAAITMACGGKFCVGATSDLEGRIYEDQVHQLKKLGKWYTKRKHLFKGSAPLPYRFEEPPGIRACAPGFRAIACRSGDDVLLHLINLKGLAVDLGVVISGREWKSFSEFIIEPEGVRLRPKFTYDGICLRVERDIVDPVDTIVRMRRS